MAHLNIFLKMFKEFGNIPHNMNMEGEVGASVDSIKETLVAQHILWG